MRIGFIGAGGTGKTTTAQLLENFIPEQLFPGVARTVFKELGYTEADQRHMSKHDKWRLQKKIFDAKIQQDHDNPDGLFDRTLVDHIAYCLFRCDDAINDTTIKSMLIVTAENMAKYDQLFYFPVYDWVPDADQLRETNLSYRMAIDFMVQGIIRNLGIPYFRVPNGAPDQRAQAVLKVIQDGRVVGEAPSQT